MTLKNQRDIQAGKSAVEHEREEIARSHRLYLHLAAKIETYQAGFGQPPTMYDFMEWRNCAEEIARRKNLGSDDWAINTKLGTCAEDPRRVRAAVRTHHTIKISDAYSFIKRRDNIDKMEQNFNNFLHVLDTRGLKAGLQWLNDRVPHRWTAIYKLDRSVMHNIQIVDKQNDPDLGALAAVPLQDSFCQFAMRDGKFVSFHTAEDTDPRLEGHAYKGVVNAYVGLPLMTSVDQMYGTLCHFDVSEQSVADEEFHFLQRVSRTLPSYLDRTSINGESLRS